MADQSEVILALAEEMRPQLAPQFGEYEVELRDAINATVNLKTEKGETFVLTIYGNHVLLVPEEEYVDDRVPTLVEQVISKHLDAISKSTNSISQEIGWEATWTVAIKKPDTGRWFIIDPGEDGIVSIIPEDMYGM